MLQHAQLPFIIFVALERPQTSVRLLDLVRESPLIFNTFFNDLIMSSSTSLRPEVVQALVLVVDLLLRLGQRRVRGVPQFAQLVVGLALDALGLGDLRSGSVANAVSGRGVAAMA